MQLRTNNYEWNTLDLLGHGTYGHVYKVSFSELKNSKSYENIVKYTKKV